MWNPGLFIRPASSLFALGMTKELNSHCGQNEKHRKPFRTAQQFPQKEKKKLHFQHMSRTPAHIWLT